MLVVGRWLIELWTLHRRPFKKKFSIALLSVGILIKNQAVESSSVEDYPLAPVFIYSYEYLGEFEVHIAKQWHYKVEHDEGWRQHQFSYTHK